MSISANDNYEVPAKKFKKDLSVKGTPSAKYASDASSSPDSRVLVEDTAQDDGSHLESPSPARFSQSTAPKTLKSRFSCAQSDISKASPFTKSLMAGTSEDGKQDCFDKTLLLFKVHLQNSLSVLSDPNYVEQVNDWKETLEQNEVDGKHILGFFMAEMKKFETKTLQQISSVKPQGMELLSSMFAGNSTSKFEDHDDTHHSTTQSAQRIPGVAKKDQTMCRACKKYFKKKPGFDSICSKEECQDRKCQKCDEDRVIAKGKKCCEPCSKAKN